MTGDGRLVCVSCGHDAGYNRAVVDTVTDELVGGLCLHCERTSFDSRLDSVRSRPDCAICERDGFFALPKWQVRRATSRNPGSVTVGYAVDERTARICDGHFDALATTAGSDVKAGDRHEPYEHL